MNWPLRQKEEYISGRRKKGQLKNTERAKPRVRAKTRETIKQVGEWFLSHDLIPVVSL